ncbi:LacI family DNA-binding transcriptional regulator [Lentilactobacillus senioris]|uniref:LacI family DNA-binding transcriptional regulator n=1 Tax=Lentilactobacillus senioris TaxID=931534 RepID=UPI002280E67D|nr:LacI family DNA-binding transcriptional regulator [Lentilactobacillus senioris]MCY9807680.1 LacI family DNA-binding transcriptional regulator [Lentilactobacillus senioris]
MKYGMKDIAKEAGVSLTTVSLVLNNKFIRISDKKKQEIKKIAKKMNYRPNSAAVSLSKQISYNIALIVPDISNPFFSELVKNVSTQLNINLYNTLLVNSDNSYKNEKKAIQNALSQGVDGILLVPSNELFSVDRSEVEHFISEIDKPFIFLNAYSDMNINYVNFDNIKGAEMATQELIDHHHQNIAFIKGKDKFVNANERYIGYQNVLSQNNIKLNENFVFEGDYTMKSGYKLAPKILKNNKITGIVSSNDLMLFGMIKWAKQNDFPVFEKLSMVGFDNNPYTEVLEHPLTTIDQDINEMALKSVKLLLEMISSNKKIKKEIIIKPYLIKRETVHDI